MNKIKAFRILIGLLLLNSSLMIGQKETFKQKEPNQEKGKKYDRSLDSMWSKDVVIYHLSPDANWLAFTEYFNQKDDQVYLSHTSKNILLKLDKSSKMEFGSNSNWFANLAPNEEMSLINLKNQSIQKNRDVLDFGFSSDGDYIAYIKRDSSQKKTLKIKNLIKDQEISLKEVNSFIWNPNSNLILAINSNTDRSWLTLINVENNSQKILLESSENEFEIVKWNYTGTAALITLLVKGNYKIYVFDNNFKLKELNNDLLEKQFPGYSISSCEPYISENADKIAFYREQKGDVKNNLENDLEIWDSKDVWVYPRMELYNEIVLNKLLTTWYPKTDRIIEIESEAFPKSVMDVNHSTAILFNPTQYEPLYKSDVNADLFIKNINTGEISLVCKNQYLEDGFVSISPCQKYISYFRDGNWFVYDVKKKTTVNITLKMNEEFENSDNEHVRDYKPYGSPLWTEDDEFFVIHDKYDIWLMSPNGKLRERITNGKEQQIVYRISQANGMYRKFESSSFNTEFSSYSLNLDNGLLLEMSDINNYKSGYSIWYQSKPIKPLIFENKKVSNALISEDLTKLIIGKQRYNSPIGIYSIDVRENKEKLLYQTNEKLNNYDLGFSETIDYTLEDGTNLKATLLYPSNYDPSKTYPMIVDIYEIQSSRVLDFMPPSEYGWSGLNPLNFITSDYFVLYPDIKYEIGNPGGSALKCVKKAVNKVLEMNKVDKENIGLIGHSFGGYETAFIITQTNMFKTAIAGCPVTDVISLYHDVWWEGYDGQMWRLENQQFRFGDSFYNMKSDYYRNSPLHHIENVKTPLLIWTGKEDSNVNWTQSIEFFNGLKRLGKESKLLLFKNETHVLLKKSNQSKLSNEIQNWFNKYLKNDS